MHAGELNRGHSGNSPILVVNFIVVMMLCGYLLADIASGFAVIQLGIDLKISLLYKMPLFILLMVLLCRYQFKTFIALLGMILVLFVSPAVELFRLPVASFFTKDFAHIIKIMMPVAVFCYLGALYQHAPTFAERWIKIGLWSNFIILFGNLMLGAMGFGRPSYSFSEEDTAGSNGFIYAANELGPTFIVLFGYALHQIWNHYRKYYLVAMVVTMLCGVLVATKTAMLSGFLLTFLIPIFNERQLFFRLTWLKLKLFAPAFLLVLAVVIFIIDLLESIGLYDRILWIFSQNGIIGVLWSGRDMFVKDLLTVYFEHSSLFQQVFGQGTGGVAEHLPIKYSAEVDAVDALVWYGFAGLLVCLGISGYFIRRAALSFMLPNSKAAPCVLLANILILFLSQISGHVWMSGTLGISLGLLNGLLWLEPNKKEILDV